MDKLQEFINRLNGQKGVGNTPENKGECVGLVMVWLKDTLKLPHVWGHAYQLLTGADKNFYTRVVNTPTGVPPRGSVMVWKKSFNGTFGHTAIVTRADVNTFEVFEQNNPTGSGCRLHTYTNYNHVDGWIIPKAPLDQQAVIDQLRAERDKNWNLYQDALKQLAPKDQRIKELGDLVLKLQDRLARIKTITNE